MTPFYLQTDTEADMWTALDELGFVAEHDGERYITVEHSIIQRVEALENAGAPE